MAEYFCTHTLPGLPIKLKAHWQTCRPPHKPHICHFISHNAHCITVHPVQVKQKLFALCAKKLKRCPHCPIWGASNTKLKALELWRHQNPQHIPSKHTFETATCTLHTIHSTLQELQEYLNHSQKLSTLAHCTALQKCAPLQCIVIRIVQLTAEQRNMSWSEAPRPCPGPRTPPPSNNCAQHLQQHT